MSVSIMTISITTLSITTLSIRTLRIKGLFVTVSMNDTQHANTLPICEYRILFIIILIVIMLNVVMLRVVLPDKNVIERKGLTSLFHSNRS